MSEKRNRHITAGAFVLTIAMSLATVSVRCGDTIAAKPTTAKPTTAKFVERLRQGQHLTIVAMGTSLTGGTWRWPDVMMNDWLNKDFPGLVTFFNEGVGASSSSQGPGGNRALSGLGKSPSVIAHKPDVVFIEFGTNDAYLPYKTSLADSKKNLNTIIDRILAANPTTEIILQTMNSCKDKPGIGPSATDRPQLAAYFQGYRDVAQQRGLRLVDHYPNWRKIMTEDMKLFDRLVPDGIHPRAEGYRKVLLPQLKASLMPLDVANELQFLEPLHGEIIFAGAGDGARTYERSDRGDYAQNSFVAEATVTLKGGGGAGCAFFGMGKGTADSLFFGEPATKPSLYLRMCPSDFVGGQVSVSADGHEAGQGSSEVGDGTHRIRLTWDAVRKRALFEIATNWDGKLFHADSAVTVDAASVAFNEDGRLFVGGGGGVKFSAFSVRPLSETEVQKARFGETFRNDPSAGTWLPGGVYQSTTVSPEINHFLKPLSASLRLLGCWYRGSELAASRPFVGGELRTGASRWTAGVRATPVAGDKDAMDLNLTFKLTEGSTSPAGVAAAFDLANWNADNYVLIPASVYNGNRNRIVARGYAAGLDRKELYNKNLPITHGQVPCLAWESGKHSKLEVSACNAATPAIAIFNPKTHKGLIILAEQGIARANGDVIDNAFCVQESADRTRATLVVSSPGVRQFKPEFIGFSASPDRGANLKEGDQIAMHLRVFRFDTPNIPGLLEKFMAVRKAVTGPNHPRNLIPQSETIKLMSGRIDSRWHNGVDKFYCPENADWISFGWIGGFIDTFPMLALGDDMHLDRAGKTFDFGLKAQGKSGYYYGCINAAGKPFGREGYDDHQEIVLTRKNGDILFWMMKQFEVLKAQGKAAAIKPEWEQSMQRLARAFVATWKKDGQWGNDLNVETGEVAIYNTTGGIMAAGGFALAADYFHEPEFLSVAKEAADFYYQRDFVKRGFTCGACADIMQNADSETAAGLMTALMALYDVTGDARWLDKSRNAANLCATWTVSYDYKLPKDSQLAQLGAKLAGVVWASTQNKHGAPGICTSSGDPLFKIYRATGDARYAELMRDILHAHAEGIQPDGEISERLTYCDADSRGTRGSGSTGWNELNGILMAMELPGIYLRTDIDRLYVFDAVEVNAVKRDAGGVTFQITNPTRFTAQVAIFAESAQQAAKPLGYTAFLKWPRVEVKAGETARIFINPAGEILGPSRK